MIRRSIIAHAVVSLIAMILLGLSFNFGTAEVYLFPRIISVGIAILALMMWFDKTDDSGGRVNFKVLWPGLLVAIVYIFVLEWLGFYLSSFLAFFAVLMIYQQERDNSPKAIGFKLLVSAGFVLILYALFSVMLNVRTPTGIFL